MTHARLAKLFRGYPEHLERAIADLKDNECVSIVAHRHITPIIDAISTNAGQPMLAPYVAYIIQHTISNNTHT